MAFAVTTFSRYPMDRGSIPPLDTVGDNLSKQGLYTPDLVFYEATRIALS